MWAALVASEQMAAGTVVFYAAYSYLVTPK